MWSMSLPRSIQSPRLRPTGTTASSSMLGGVRGVKKLAMGSSSRMVNHSTSSIHAEHDCMQKTARLNRYRRFLSPGDKVDVMVVRMSRSGIIGYSRPCRNCLRRLAKSKYPINQIYYTIDPDKLVVERFSEMYDSPLTKMSSADRRSSSTEHSSEDDNDERRRGRKSARRRKKACKHTSCNHSNCKRSRSIGRNKRSRRSRSR